MSQSAPAFAEASLCKTCKKSFTMLNRRHHCRNCGQSVCADHWTKSIALPHFGLNDTQKVCDECYVSVSSKNNASNGNNGNGNGNGNGSNTQKQQKEKEKDSGLGGSLSSSNAPSAAAPKPVVPNFKCTCGMPLCICVPPEPEPVANEPKKETSSNNSNSSSGNNNNTPKPKPATTTATTSTFQSFGASLSNVDLNGNKEEQCREAIKRGDKDAVKKLLDAGCNPKWADRQGQTLLHMAAMFNQGDIAIALIGKGADVNATNREGETALDLAAPTLRSRMLAQ